MQVIKGGYAVPIKIPDKLPAYSVLRNENIFVMSEDRAFHQDIRPLRLLILNLMPTKIVTETQLLRKLSNTPLQIEVELLRMRSHESKNTDADHLSSFYTTFDVVKGNRYDGMIITGAPVENLDFYDVDYWPELCQIMKWTSTNVYSTLHICWGAQAALFYHHGIDKHQLPAKISGIYTHKVVDPSEPLFFGFDRHFNAPHSRYTTVLEDDIAECPKIKLLAVSEKAGVFACMSTDERKIFIFGHPEYDAETLDLEYKRDIAKGMNAAIPESYYPNDDPSLPPETTWRSHGSLLYSNWLNYYVYQATPFDLGSLN